jgi:hypothetical protein
MTGVLRLALLAMTVVLRFALLAMTAGVADGGVSNEV